MTVFDYVVLALMAASVFLGAWRGVLGEIIALLAWILAFLAAKWWGVVFANAVFAFIEDPSLRLLAGWAAVFILVLILMGILRLAVRALVSAVGLGLSDRFLGFVFGFARGLVVILAVMMAFGMTAIPQEKWWKDAYFSAPLEHLVLLSTPWLPDEIVRRIRFK